MEAIRAGDLRCKFQIQRMTQVVNASGEPIPTPSIWGKPFYGSLDMATGHELPFAKTDVATATYKIKTYYFSGLLPTDLLLLNGRTFSINAIDNVENRNRQLMIYVTEQRTLTPS